MPSTRSECLYVSWHVYVTLEWCLPQEEELRKRTTRLLLLLLLEGVAREQMNSQDAVEIKKWKFNLATGTREKGREGKGQKIPPEFSV